MERFESGKIKAVKEVLLNGVKQIAIIPHLNPDGDAMGSCLGLKRVLRNRGYEVKVICPSDFPEFLKWLPGLSNTLIFSEQKEEAEQFLESSDLVFCLDFNDLKRAGDLVDVLERYQGPKVLIDHHPHPQEFADYIFSYPKASSTCELVYEFVLQIGLKENLDKDVATCLFTGILTDTGSFSYNSSDSRTFNVVADLLDYGVEKDRIHSRVFNNYSADRMRLMGHCIGTKMVVLPEYRTAYISLSDADMKKFNFQPGDNEGFVNIPLSINGIIFTVFFTENEDRIKISFRSKGKFATNEFSAKHFNGGGHRNASGGESKVSLEETVKKFLSLLPDYKDDLLSVVI